MIIDSPSARALSLILFLILNLFSLPLSAQNTYDFSVKKEGIIMGVSAAVLTSSFVFGKRTLAIDYDEWLELDRNNVFFIDRSVTYNWDLKIQKRSDFLVQTSVAAPLFIAVSRDSWGEAGAVGLLTLETAALTFGITNISKNLFRRRRPFTYNKEMLPWEVMKLQKLKDARRSFISGHTSTTAAMYFVSAQMYSDFHPNSKFKPVAWATAAVIPALTGLMRVRGGKHYYTDVIFGYAVGALVGVFIPKLHR